MLSSASTGDLSMWHINLAFGLTLGAAAVAFALAFGLGGRDLAARTLEEWRAQDAKDRPKQ